jgi:DNA-binding CsgD family transcriptional regulator/transcriptional regulator with GAF, ATPase, and Fis domain
VNRIPHHTPSQRVSTLSAREIEIARLYARGQTSSEIAEGLFISKTTVRNHVATIYRKLAVRSKTELVTLLVEAGEIGSVVKALPLEESIIAQNADLSLTERSLMNHQAQQRATNEVLRVISHSPGDLDAIFDVILDYALQLSHSQLGIVYLCVDGGFTATALKNVPSAFQEYLQARTICPNPKTGLGRMWKQHRIIHIHDVRSEDLYRDGDPLRIATADLGGARSFIAIPMIQRATLVGAFTLYRQEVKPFNDDELTMLQAFSDQAAIALTITRLLDDTTRLQKIVKDQASILDTKIPEPKEQSGLRVTSTGSKNS